MRKFKLRNAQGQEYNLMRKDAFFHAPDGLGMSSTKNFMNAGFDWIKTSDVLNQKNVTGEMMFKEYKVYTEFTQFCMHAPLVLCYMPTDRWYYLDCELAAIGKTEIDPATGRLLCPVDFAGLGTWYESISASRPSLDISRAKKYANHYPYTYASGVIGTVRVENRGQNGSPIDLYMYGPCLNPQWSLSQNGKMLATGRIVGRVGDGEVLIVRSAPSMLGIAIYNTTSMERLRDMYPHSDFSTERFLYAPMGKSSVTVLQAGTQAVKALVEVKQLAATV